MKAIAHPNTQKNEKNHIPALKNCLTKEDLQALFQKTLERTSSSPSGVHMGHYKAIFMDD